MEVQFEQIFSLGLPVLLKCMDKTQTKSYDMVNW